MSTTSRASGDGTPEVPAPGPESDVKALAALYWTAYTSADPHPARYADLDAKLRGEIERGIEAVAHQVIRDFLSGDTS